MRTLAFFIVTALGAALATAAQSGDFPQRFARDGFLMLVHLDSAPFPHPSRAEGHRYKDQFFSAKEHYSDNTVAIFIPRNFRVNETVDFVVHFHGWHNNVTNVLVEYQLVEQLIASGRNAILVVPQGPRDAADSFGGKLEDPDGFKQLMKDVVSRLREVPPFTNAAATIGSIILSGHSGGYHVISSILDHGGLASRIREVWLFDALYAQTPQFLAWLEKSDGRLLVIYTESGGTKAETEKMMETLKKRNRTFLSLKEKGLSVDALRSNVPVFLYSELPHNDVVARHQTFRDFLRASTLTGTE